MFGVKLVTMGPSEMIVNNAARIFVSFEKKIDFYKEICQKIGFFTKGDLIRYKIS